MDISIIIPSRNEMFLQDTIEDIIKKARSDYEILPIMEGGGKEPVKHERVRYIHTDPPLGLRGAVTRGVEEAKGDFIMKVDGHCAFGKAFDELIMRNHQDNWISIPRRYALDVEKWDREEPDGKYPIDYLYVENPAKSRNQDLAGIVWTEKNRDKELESKLIDDIITFQGSCWVMKKDYFYELEGFDEENYGTFRKEPQELSFKCWLSGGKVVRNKKTWYAHLYKGRMYGRGYSADSEDHKKGDTYNSRWIVDEAWNSPKRVKTFKWLVEKFMPMPGWEDFDWENAKTLPKYTY